MANEDEYYEIIESLTASKWLQRNYELELEFQEPFW